MEYSWINIYLHFADFTKRCRKMELEQSVYMQEGFDHHLIYIMYIMCVAPV